MTRDKILKELVNDTLTLLKDSEQEIDVLNTLTAQFDRALDIGTNYLKFNRSTGIQIEQMDEFGNPVGYYDSIHQAAKFTGIHRTGIRNVLKGTQHTAGGYIWKKLTATNNIP